MRRRRSRGTWFPVIGTQPSEELSYAPIRLTFQVASADGFEQRVTGVVPVTFDRPQEGDELSTTADSLAEILGNEYTLKRIVGKCFVTRSTNADRNGTVSPYTYEQAFPALLVGCGFFVARAQDEQDPGGQDLPIGTTGNSAVNEEKIWENYSPLALSTIREPWIWRRSWILGNGAAINAVNQSVVQTVSNDNPVIAGEIWDFPANNTQYGSIMDGPHLDSRVKRRVGQDDRLWFAVGIVPLQTIVTPVTGAIINTYVHVVLDYRLFGSLRKAKNRSAF